MTIILRLQLLWAKLTGDNSKALALSKEILMADFSSFDAALSRVQAKVQADAAALSDAQGKLSAAEADAAALQGQIDQRTTQLEALAPAA